jgi:glycosyltransferase involved in cell wall biosynthesis
MNLAFEATEAFRSGTSIGFYSRMFIQEVSNEYPHLNYFLFKQKKDRYFLSDFFNKNASHKVLQPEGWFQRTFPDYWKREALGKQLAENKVDVIHGLGGVIPQFLPPWVKTKRILTLHDFSLFLDKTKAAGLDYPFEKSTISKKIAKADVTFTFHEKAKEVLCDKFNISEHKITTLNGCCHRMFFDHHPDEPLGGNPFGYLPPKYVVFVGSPGPEKNLELVLDAMSRKELKGNFFLLFVGKSTSHSDKIKSKITMLGLERFTSFQSSITSSLLLHVYKNAELLISPAHYEMYPVSILEAMTQKVPVLASDYPWNREYGGDAVMYFNPDSVEDFAAKMVSILNDEQLRNRLKEKGMEQAKQFHPQIIVQKAMFHYT